MNYRINKSVVLLVTLMVLLAIGLFVYTLVSAPTETFTVEPQDPSATEPTEERLITARHQFAENIHTIAGTAEVATPCHRLITEPFFVHGDSDSVEVRFSTLLEGEECPSEPFEAPFRVSFEALENATITATWNGNPARLNLIPLNPGESIEDELYIKG